MKKLIFATGFLMLLLVNAYSQSSSNVTVFSQDGEKFWVIINGIKQNDTPQTNVKVTGLTEPNYKLKVIFLDETIPSIDKMVYTRDYDGKFFNCSYVVKKDKKGKFVVSLNSYDEAPAASAGQFSTPLSLQEKPATTTTQTQPPAQTTTQTKPQTTQTTTTQTTTVNQNVAADPNGAVNINMNVTDPETGKPVNMNVGVGVNATGIPAQSTSTTVVTTTTTTTTDPAVRQNVTHQERPVPVAVAKETPPDHYIMQGYNGPIGCPWPMSETDYTSAKQSISSKSFEDDKLTISKQVLGSNCMTCEQIKGVMKVFSFEDSRIEFAKYAYGYVYDPGNYYKVNDAFTFSSSIDDLNEYISTHKK
jgi:hypothetical protein